MCYTMVLMSSSSLSSSSKLIIQNNNDQHYMYTVSQKNDNDVAHYNFNTH